jgi:hypothetical protein
VSRGSLATWGRTVRAWVLADPRKLLAALYVLAFLPRAVLAISQPVWSRTDEAFHADYVAQLAHGVYPVEGSTLIRPEIEAVMRQTGVYRWDAYMNAHPDPAAWRAGPPPGMSPHARIVWTRRNLWRYSYEAFQPPVYYAAMVPVWASVSSVGGTWAAIYALRLVNAALGAALAPLAYLIALALWAERRAVAIFAGALAALLPGQVMNGSAITNDTPAAVLATTAVAVALAAAGRRPSWRRVLSAGVLFGIAVAVKPLALGVAPALWLVLNWQALRARDVQAALRTTAWLFAPVVVLMLGWAAINLAVYHVATTAGAAAQLNTVEVTPSFSDALVSDLLFSYTTFWLGEPTDFTVAATLLPFGLAIYLLPLLSFFGLIHLRRVRIDRVVAGALGLGIAGQMAFTLLSPLLVGSGFMTPGRYLYPAAALVLVLVAAGAWLEFPPRGVRRLVPAAWLAALAAVLVAFAVAPPYRVSGPVGGPSTSAAPQPVTAAAKLGGLTIQVDRMALDSACSCTWVHVIESYDGDGQADLSQTADVVVGGAIVGQSIYMEGTRLPETLRSGDRASGWLRLTIRPEQVRAAREFQLAFRDMAVASYRSVSDVYVRIGP